MKKFAWMLVLGVVLSGAAFAAGPPPPAPEMNASSAASALALISGAVLVIRGRRKA